MFWAEWEKGTATVVARRFVREVNASRAHGPRRRKFEFILDVVPSDGSPDFRATCVEWSNHVQDDVVNVEYKARNGKVRFDRVRTGGRKKRPVPKTDVDRWQAMIRDEPGTAPPPRRGN